MLGANSLRPYYKSYCENINTAYEYRQNNVRTVERLHLSVQCKFTTKCLSIMVALRLQSNSPRSLAGGKSE